MCWYSAQGEWQGWWGSTFTDGLGRIGRELHHSWGKIKQRLEAHKRGGEGNGVLGHGAAALCESRTQR